MFKLLNNIYDIYDLSFLFNNDMINSYLKLFEKFIDFNNLPEVSLWVSKIKEDLQHFLTLFSLCMNNHISYRLRIKLLRNNFDFLYKIIIISTTLSGTCCCGHAFNSRSYSCQKAVDSIFKLLSHIDNSPIDYNQINTGFLFSLSFFASNKIDINLFNKAQQLKIKIADFLCKKAGKNVCFVYLNKLMEICKNKNISAYLLSETNLFFEVIKKDESSIHHLIDSFEKFINLVNEPKECLSFLNKLSSYDLHKYNRISREMIKRIINSSDKSIITSLYEGSIFKNIINLISCAIIDKNISLIEVEGIFESILVVNNTEIISIFYQKKFSIKNYFSQLFDYYIKNNYLGYSMDSAFRIMILFIGIGDKVKQKYNCQNFYIEELRDIYHKINSISSLGSEDSINFKNYFKK